VIDMVGPRNSSSTRHTSRRRNWVAQLRRQIGQRLRGWTGRCHISTAAAGQTRRRTTCRSVPETAAPQVACDVAMRVSNCVLTAGIAKRIAGVIAQSSPARMDGVDRRAEVAPEGADVAHCRRERHCSARRHYRSADCPRNLVRSCRTGWRRPRKVRMLPKNGEASPQKVRMLPMKVRILPTWAFRSPL